MELRQLRYFVAVAETRHFGQAARRLHMAQSPLSQAIRQLEAQLGVVLFLRSTRHVELTQAGETLLRDARQILESADQAATRVGLVAGGHLGLLRVGATGLAAFRHLPMLARIASRHTPGVQLRYRPDMVTPAQEKALVEHQIDLAVLRPPLRTTGLTQRLVSREHLVVAVPHDHRTGPGPVSLADLRDEAFIVSDAHDSTTSVVDRACADAGFSPRRAAEAGQISIMLTLVAAGLGVAVLPESVLALHVEGVRFVPVRSDATVDLGLAWRTDDTSPALHQLLDALQAEGFTAPAESAAPR